MYSRRIKIEDGKQKLSGLDIGESIAFVFENKIIDMHGIRIFADEGKVHLKGGETLHDSYKLIRKWMPDSY